MQEGKLPRNTQGEVKERKYSEGKNREEEQEGGTGRRNRKGRNRKMRHR